MKPLELLSSLAQSAAQNQNIDAISNWEVYFPPRTGNRFSCLAFSTD